MTESEPGQELSNDQQEAAPRQPPPEVRPRSTTIGIGSSIGIGCLIVVVLLVVVAFAIRSIFGSW